MADDYPVSHHCPVDLGLGCADETLIPLAIRASISSGRLGRGGKSTWRLPQYHHRLPPLRLPKQFLRQFPPERGRFRGLAGWLQGTLSMCVLGAKAIRDPIWDNGTEGAYIRWFIPLILHVRALGFASSQQLLRSKGSRRSIIGLKERIKCSVKGIHRIVVTPF